MSEKKPKVFYFHIPKCAGMSVWDTLWDQYGIENVLQVGIKDQRLAFESMSPEDALKYDAIGGHGWLMLYRGKLGEMEDYYKITTLRHPVDRVISAYNFISHLEDHHSHEVVKQQTIEEFASAEMHNMMCRLLAGSTDHKDAIEVLENYFDAFCYLEDLDVLMEKLLHNFGREYEPIGHKNESQKIHTRDTIDSKAIKIMEERNYADMRLYHHYKSRYPYAMLSNLAGWARRCIGLKEK